MKRSLIAAVLLVSLAACSHATPPAAPPPATQHASAIAFVDDDYAAALSRARAEKKPLFVDAWAPWCHSCLSTRAYVFTDPTLQPLADRFVWLAVDTEKASNAPFVAKFPIEEWPTLMVIDPSTETPVLKWGGSGTAAELKILLEDSEQAIAHGDASQGEAAAAFVRANALVAGGKHAEAAKEYQASLAAAPADWSRKARIYEALTSELRAVDDVHACMHVAKEALGKMGVSTSRAVVAMNGAECAREVAITHDEAGSEELRFFVDEIEKMADDASAPLLADDRSDLYGEVVDVKESAFEDAAGAKKVAAKWSAFLDAQAKAAPNPAARAVFDAHRMLAYLALETPEKAVPMLLESEKDFPDDYNAPARLAKVYLEMGKLDDASTAIDRALGKAYGPRKMRLYALKADVAIAKKDAAGAKAALAEGVKLGESLAVTGGYAKVLAELKARLAKL